MRGVTQKKQSQRGSTSVSVIVMSTGLLIASAMLVSKIRDIKKAKKNEIGMDTDRRVNEAALQVLTQLIANGVIFYNPTCAKAVPQTVGVANQMTAGGTAVTPYSDDGSGCGFSAAGTMASGFDCNSATSPGWLYRTEDSRVVVDVCVPVTEKNSSGVYEVTKIPVPVTFLSYREKTFEREALDIEDSVASESTLENVKRHFGMVRVRRTGMKANRSPYPTLDGEINFGVVQDANNGLLGKHGAADLCYYMRPRTKSQGAGATESDDNDPKKYRGFVDRNPTTDMDDLYKRYKLHDLEPRPDGRLADQYGADYSWDELVKSEDKPIKQKLEKNFLLLEDFLEKPGKVFDAYVSGLRVGRNPFGNNFDSSPISEELAVVSMANEEGVITRAGAKTSDGKYCLSRDKYKVDREAYKSYFVGVMPKYAPEGPKFKHFLTGSKSEPNKWNNSDDVEERKAFLNDLKQGCENSGKSDKAKFCTRVEIPYEKLQLTFRKRCVQKEYIIPSAPVSTGPTPYVRYSNAAVNVSCDPNWVAKVKNLFQAFKNNNEGEKKMSDAKKEMNFQQVLSALEVDDDFQSQSGVWASDFFEYDSSLGEKPYDAYLAHRSALGSVEGEQFKYTGNVNYIEDPCDPVCDDDGNCTADCPPVERYGGDTPVTVWEYEDTPTAEPLTHTSQICSYYYYKEPHRANRCRYNFKTVLNEDHICRNKDGCFDESTHIRMADGTEKRVTQLKNGEFVFNPITGKPARIVKLVAGPEFKPLIHVSVDGRVVKVTETHPFMTKRGWVQAKNMKVGDEVRSTGGGYLPVTQVSLGESGRMVVNLALDGSAAQPELHYVLADGVVTGDLVIQNLIEARASNP
jgi:hypothetical protein